MDVMERGETGAFRRYSNVAWYPEGTDGWQRADLPVAESQPQPREDEEGPSLR